MTHDNRRDWEEMPKMCALPAGAGGDLVYVNPVNVLYVKASAPERTLIYFSNNESLNVAVSVDTVVRSLDISMNVDHA